MSPFDQEIDRTGTGCMKWDAMEARYGVSPEDGLAMWVADMDFLAPDCIQTALQRMTAHGIYGYAGSDAGYRAAIGWWMQERHGWTVQPDWIFTTHGLVNAVALCLQAWSQPGDGIVLFSPVYHAFARTIRGAGREVVECPLVLKDDRYEMDFDAWDGQMTGKERMLILCSPHNPGGRVWTRSELQGVADFARRHGLILVSDEIHHDLIMPGHVHVPMALVDDAVTERLVMLTAPTKTFNIAGAHTGNVIVPDPELRGQFAQVMTSLSLSPNSFGVAMAEAAYSPEGAAWVDDLCIYLDGNRRLFDAGVNAIPGLKSMPMEATYLAWVDFDGTGMPREEFTRRVEQDARIAVNHGPTFGVGGDSFLRFNFATPRARVEEAVQRLQTAFGDLQ